MMMARSRRAQRSRSGESFGGTTSSGCTSTSTSATRSLMLWVEVCSVCICGTRGGRQGEGVAPARIPHHSLTFYELCYCAATARYCCRPLLPPPVTAAARHCCRPSLSPPVTVAARRCCHIAALPTRCCPAADALPPCRHPAAAPRRLRSGVRGAGRTRSRWRRACSHQKDP